MPLMMDAQMTQTVREHFKRDVEIIDRLLGDDSQSDQWHVEPGSALARDDAAMEGAAEPISAQAHRLLHASTDFLHGVSTMILKANVLHAYAEYAMIRSGLECAGYAWWLLESSSRTERIRRSLRLYWQDTKDLGEMVGDAPAWRDMKRERLRARDYLARRNGIDPVNLDGGASATTALKRMNAVTHLGVLTAWRVASGMTHGRIWALGALGAFDISGEPEGATLPASISVDIDSLAMVFHNAAIALQEAHVVFHQRRRPTDRTAFGLPLNSPQ